MKIRNLIFGIISAFVVFIAAEVSFHEFSQTVLQGSSKHQSAQLTSTDAVVILGENSSEIKHSPASSEKYGPANSQQAGAVVDAEFQKSQAAILDKSGCPVDARQRLATQIHPFHFFW